MFSPQDARSLMQVFPPDQDLLSLMSNTGLIPGESVRRAFEDTLNATGTTRISVSKLASELDITEAKIYELASDRSEGTLFSSDRKSLISRDERVRLLEALRLKLAASIVDKATFARDYDIEMISVDYLARELSGTGNYTSQLEKTETLRLPNGVEGLYTLKYRMRTLEDLTIIFFKAQDQAEAIPIARNDSSMFDQELRKELAHHFLRDQGKQLPGRLEQIGSALNFIPWTREVKARDAAVHRLLWSGKHFKNFCVPSTWFVAEFPLLYASIVEVEEYFYNEYPKDVIILEGVIYQKLHWEGIADQKVYLIEVYGFVKLAVEGFDEQPTTVTPILDWMRERIFTQLGDIMSIGESADEYLMRMSFSLEVLAICEDITKQRVQRDYTELPVDAMYHFKDDAVASSPRLLESLNGDASLASLFVEKHHEQLAKVYLNETAALEAASDEQLADLWQDRVIARLQLHKDALETLTDEKLKGDLTGLLVSYLAKDLVPTILARARARRLVRSVKARNNVEKLEAFLAEHPQGGDADGALWIALNKFTQKLGRDHLTPDKVKEKKEAYAEDIEKGMKEDKDPARLFLALITILLARRTPGFFYATGKFAPKLLKLLKGLIAEENYKRLEELKDAIKRGAIADKDREEMRTMP